MRRIGWIPLLGLVCVTIYRECSEAVDYGLSVTFRGQCKLAWVSECRPNVVVVSRWTLIGREFLSWSWWTQTITFRKTLKALRKSILNRNRIGKESRQVREAGCECDRNSSAAWGELRSTLIGLELVDGRGVVRPMQQRRLLLSALEGRCWGLLPHPYISVVQVLLQRIQYHRGE